MLNKLYEEIKTIIKENYKFLIIMLLTFIICIIEFPYYIEAPGGVINIRDRFEIEDSYESKGSLNMAYVTEYKATIPTMLIAKFNKDWELIKRDTTNENDTSEADYKRNQILLEEANQNAVIVAYENASLNIELKDTKIYVTYVFEEANTDIKIGDQIIEVNGTKVNNKTDVKNILNNSSVNEQLTIKVINEDKELTRTAKVIEYSGNNILGVAVSEISDVITDPEIKFNFHSSESGPSGGLMMSLAIYDALTKYDITKGRKIVGTGTIDSYGNVGEIAGVEYKLKGAVKENADIFLVPAGSNYEEAKKIVNDYDYEIEIISISTFTEALEYLKSN